MIKSNGPKTQWNFGGLITPLHAVLFIKNEPRKRRNTGSEKKELRI